MSIPALVGLRGPQLESGEREMLLRLRPLGVLISRRNVENASQLTGLCRALRAELGEDLWIAADQEGGTVSALQGAAPSAPPALSFGVADDPNWTRIGHWQMATEARSLGVDLLLAPVAEVVGGEHVLLATRSFGSDAARVARQVAAAVEGIQSAGVHACVKHWPGCGRAAQLGDLEIPTVEATLEQLVARELVPFAAALEARVSSVMVGRIRVPALDRAASDASRSSSIVRDWLRRRLGFVGLILAEASETTSAAQLQEQLRAGCDAVLLPQPIGRARELLESMPLADEEVQARLRPLRPAPMEPDPAGVRMRVRRGSLVALWEEFERLRPWPPFSDALPRPAILESASGESSLRAWLREAGSPPREPAASVAPNSPLARWLGAIDAMPLDGCEFVVLAGLAPWPEGARAALRRRLSAMPRPPAVLLMGDPSPQSWLGELCPLLLCPGLQQVDLEQALGALTGRIELRLRDRWGS